MSLVVGTNSWATVSEADTYLEDIAGTEDWFNLDDDPGVNQGAESKSTYLVSAFRFLMYHPNLDGLTADLTSDQVKNAQIEMALFLSRYQGDFEERQSLVSSGVESFKAGRWEEDYSTSYPSLPGKVFALLSDYFVAYGSGVAQLRGEDYVEDE